MVKIPFWILRSIDIRSKNPVNLGSKIHFWILRKESTPKDEILLFNRKSAMLIVIVLLFKVDLIIEKVKRRH